MQSTLVPKAQTGPKHIPLELLIDYSKKNLSDTDIAKLVGCDRSNINRRLKGIREETQGLSLYKRHRADILAMMQRRLLNSLTVSEIKEMSGRDRVVSYGILYDKERLERGQSTANIGVHTLVSQHEASLADLRAQRAALEGGGAATGPTGGEAAQVVRGQAMSAGEATGDGGAKP